LRESSNVVSCKKPMMPIVADEHRQRIDNLNKLAKLRIRNVVQIKVTDIPGAGSLLI